ncbi:hypothetical protein CLU85_4004 [Acidovorax sp. 69]|uniref:hypothetical protein n=1 Tax=Acidovorax sp. 69 TaxID=2035202 RepID=UPI000C2417E6|nr:hypothetical protein [Acidovorax sp. 69]PJI99162.1 hypothetical protein CLU85_4004 [Acidovorax sp. 69]
MATEAALSECQKSLERIQTFDPETLGRVDDLGRQMNFAEAVPPAESIIALYKRIPVSTLPDFTDGQLGVIQSNANSDYNLFSQILEFSAASSNSASTRTNILATIKGRRDQIFDQLWQYVAYSVARITDTSLLETQARATIQGIEDQAAKLTGQLADAKKDADAALSAIRAVASEQGVSQQAIYFKDEAQSQENLAREWLTFTYRFAAALGAFAILSLFLHKFEWIKPTSNAEVLQLITSKILIFSVIGYLLLMAARNYATHKHNAVVNRHRQNALLTYRALVTAAESTGTQDIVLAHAASCIFSPQETGFAQGKGETSPGSKSVLELLTKGPSKSTE